MEMEVSHPPVTGTVRVAREFAEADRVINLPNMKVHSLSPAFSVNRRHPSRVADVTSFAADKPEATAGRMPFWL